VNRIPRRIWPAVAACLALTGCVDSDSNANGSATPIDSTTVAVAQDSAGDTTTAVAPEAGETVPPDPFTGFELSADPQVSAELRRLSLLLRNDGPSVVVVHADGGAEEVLLDSVPAESRHRVDLLTRAPVVTLRTEAPGGRTLSTAEVAVGPDSIVEVRVGTAAEP
jgi:hypothetical protein